MRNAIGWSYQLLDTSEQMLFARLAVFSGRFTMSAAETGCNADGDLPLAVVEGVQGLVDKSLLHHHLGDDATTFTFLETIRAYAFECLMARGDMQEQGRKLMQMLSVAVAGLTRLDTLVPAVEALGRRHQGYGVKDEHYATEGAALLWTLGQGLGAEFTPDVEVAWSHAYGLLSGVMQNAVAVPMAVA